MDSSGDIDPELLLAIALSRSLMEDSPSEPVPPAEEDNSMEEYLERLVRSLRRDELLTSRPLAHALLPLLDLMGSVSSPTPEQELFIVPFLECLVATILTSDLKRISTPAEGLGVVNCTLKGILHWCAYVLSKKTVRRKDSVLSLLELLCGVRTATRQQASNLRKELTTRIPSFKLEESGRRRADSNISTVSNTGAAQSPTLRTLDRLSSVRPYGLTQGGNGQTASSDAHTKAKEEKSSRVPEPKDRLSTLTFRGYAAARRNKPPLSRHGDKGSVAETETRSLVKGSTAADDAITTDLLIGECRRFLYANLAAPLIHVCSHDLPVPSPGPIADVSERLERAAEALGLARRGMSIIKVCADIHTDYSVLPAVLDLVDRLCGAFDWHHACLTGSAAAAAKDFMQPAAPIRPDLDWAGLWDSFWAMVKCTCQDTQVYWNFHAFVSARTLHTLLPSPGGDLSAHLKAVLLANPKAFSLSFQATVQLFENSPARGYATASMQPDLTIGYPGLRETEKAPYLSDLEECLPLASCRRSSSAASSRVLKCGSTAVLDFKDGSTHADRIAFVLSSVQGGFIDVILNLVQLAKQVLSFHRSRSSGRTSSVSSHGSGMDTGAAMEGSADEGSFLGNLFVEAAGAATNEGDGDVCDENQSEPEEALCRTAAQSAISGIQILTRFIIPGYPVTLMRDYCVLHFDGDRLSMLVRLLSELSNDQNEVLWEGEVNLMLSTRSMSYALVTSGIISDTLQVEFIKEVFAGTSPLHIPSEVVVFITRTMISRRQSCEDVDDLLAVEVWNSFLKTIRAAVTGSLPLDANLPPLRIEQTCLLMLLFHTLDVPARSTIFSSVIVAILDTLEALSPESKPGQLFAACRMLQLMEYIAFCFDKMPSDTMERLESLVLVRRVERTGQPVLDNMIAPFILASQQTARKSDPRGQATPALAPYYELGPQEDMVSVSEGALGILIGSANGQYEALYDRIVRFLSVAGTCGDGMSSEDAQRGAFFWGTTWRLLGRLVPPSSFVSTLCSSTEWLSSGAHDDVLHRMRLLLRSLLSRRGSEAIEGKLDVREHLNCCMVILKDFSKSLESGRPLSVPSVRVIDIVMLFLRLAAEGAAGQSGVQFVESSFEDVTACVINLLRNAQNRARQILADVISHIDGGDSSRNVMRALRSGVPLGVVLSSFVQDSSSLDSFMEPAILRNDHHANIRGRLLTASSDVLNQIKVERILEMTMASHTQTPVRGVMDQCLVSSKIALKSGLYLMISLLREFRGPVEARGQAWADEIIRSVLDFVVDPFFEFLKEGCGELTDALRRERGDMAICKERLIRVHQSLAEVDDQLSNESRLFRVVVQKEMEYLTDVCVDRVRRQCLVEHYLQSANAGGAGDILIVLRAISNVDDEAINSQVLHYLCALMESRLGSDALSPRGYFATAVAAAGVENLHPLFFEKLLGYKHDSLSDGSGVFRVAHSAVRTLMMKLLNLLVGDVIEPAPSHIQAAFGVVFECVLKLLKPATQHYPMCAAEIFGLLRGMSMSVPSFLPTLLYAVLDILHECGNDSSLASGLRGDLPCSNIALYLDFVSNMMSVSKEPMSRDVSMSGDLSEGAGQGGVSMMDTESADDMAGANNAALLGSGLAAAMDVAIPDTGADDGDTVSIDDEDGADLDGDEDGDGTGGGRAGQVCSYVSTGSNFTEQHWYYCYTCNLTLSEGCCSVCVKVCHKGHDVSYSRYSRFFCDCGAGPLRTGGCLALRPSGNRPQSRPMTPMEPAGNQAGSLAGGGSGEDGIGVESDDSDGEIGTEIPELAAASSVLPENLRQQITEMLAGSSILGDLMTMYRSIFEKSTQTRQTSESTTPLASEVGTKTVSQNGTIFSLRKSSKANSFELKLKSDQAKMVRSMVASGSVTRQCLAVNSRNHLALPDGDKIAIIDGAKILGPSSGLVDRSDFKFISQSSVPFEILFTSFNRENESFLAVAGMQDCRVFTLSSRGEIQAMLQIDLVLDAITPATHIVGISWLPNSQTMFAVITTRFVKIYDLSKDKISPMYNLGSMEDIRGAVFRTNDVDKTTLLLLCVDGSLYTHPVDINTQDNGSVVLQRTIDIPSQHRGITGAGIGLSDALDWLFISFEDGRSFAGRLNADATCFLGTFSLNESRDSLDLRRAVVMTNWVDFSHTSGLFACVSRKNGHAAALLIGKENVKIQHLKGSGRIEGIVSISSAKSQKLLCLHDDGSLSRHEMISPESERAKATAAAAASEATSPASILSSIRAQSARLRRLHESGAGSADDHALLSSLVDEHEARHREALAAAASRASMRMRDAPRRIDDEGPKPTFPLDFFEHVQCITPNPDVIFGGDLLPSQSADGIKKRLESPDDFITSTKYDDFILTVTVANPDMVISGIRVLLGHATLDRIPSGIRIFNRTIEVSDQMRRWYDIPFTANESIQADREVAITFMAPFSTGTNALVDSVEVYGQSKDEFGWEQKLEDRAGGSKVGPGAGSRDDAELTLSSPEKVSVSILGVLGRCLMDMNTSGRGEDTSAVRDGLVECLQSALGSAVGGGAVRRRAKSVLKLILHSKESYHVLKDRAQFSFAAKRILNEEIAHRDFEAYLRILRRVATLRPRNFLQLICDFPELPATILALFRTLYGRHRLGFANLEEVVRGMVEVLCGSSIAAVATNAGWDDAKTRCKPFFELLWGLLSSEDAVIRSLSAGAIADAFVGKHVVREATATSSSKTSGSGSGSRRPPRAGVSRSAPRSVEEPANTTSVIQYCCDLCHQCPLVGARWHCEVCADYDLCEACYIAQASLPPSTGSDHLPSHSMTKILLSQPNPNPASSTTPADKNSSKDTQVLGCGPLATIRRGGGAIVQKAPGASSCLDVEGLSALLSSYIVDCFLSSADMMTGGVRVIPTFQALYFLSLHADSSSYGERTSAEISRIAKRVLLPHSSQMTDDVIPSEPVVVMAVMLVSNILQENDSRVISEDAFRSKVYGALKDMDIVEVLFKIANSRKDQVLTTGPDDSGRSEKDAAMSGSRLLNPRFGSQIRHYSPFFSSSHLRSHGVDIFRDVTKVLFESILRLVVLLHGQRLTPANVSSDDWIPLLCSIIEDKSMSFVRKQAKKLLLAICGGKVSYYQARDDRMYQTHLGVVRRLHEQSHGFTEPLAYENTVALLAAMNSILDAASTRPINWQTYCAAQRETVPFLMDSFYSTGEEPMLLAMKIISLAFADPKDVEEKAPPTNSSTKHDKTAEKSRRSSRESGKDTNSTRRVKQHPVDINRLIPFSYAYLLESNRSGIRSEARDIIFGIWNNASREERSEIFGALVRAAPHLPQYGRNALEYSELLSYMVTQLSDSEDASLKESIKGFALELLRALHQQNSLIVNHPNSNIYKQLGTLVELDGYYLESEPCLVCNDPEVAFSQLSFDDMKAEIKYTDVTKIVKFTGCFQIQSVVLRIADAKKAKMIKTLNLYYNNKPVTDVNELKNKWNLWKKAKSCHVSVNQNEVVVDFPLPISATNFMVEYAALHENLSGGGPERLQCPRCSRHVTDKHGVCKHCRENAYQCRHCRNINYENLDAFLCNECGYSKYGKFDFQFVARPSVALERIENDSDKNKGLSTIAAESQNALKCYEKLMSWKKPLMRILSSLGDSAASGESIDQILKSVPGVSTLRVNRKICILAVLYGKECSSSFTSLSKSVQTLLANRRELIRYMNRGGEANTAASDLSRPENTCFGCANMFIGQCLGVLEHLSCKESVRRTLVDGGIVRELFVNNLHQGTSQDRENTRRVLCQFVAGDRDASNELHGLIRERVSFAIENHQSFDVAAMVKDEIRLLSDLCKIEDSQWEARLKVVLELLFAAVNKALNSPVVAECVVQPTLKIINQVCKPPTASADEAGIRHTADNLGSLDDDDPMDIQIDGQEIPLPLFLSTEGAPSVRYSDWLANKVDYNSWFSAKKQRGDAGGVDLSSLPFEGAVHPRVVGVVRKFASRWMNKTGLQSQQASLQALMSDTWISKLLLSRCSQAVRADTSALIETLCGDSSSRTYRFLDMLVGMLEKAGDAGESAAELFELLKNLLNGWDERLLYITAKGYIRYLAKLIIKEIGRLNAQEKSYSTDISQGSVLRHFIDLLSSALKHPRVCEWFKREELVTDILGAYLTLRGLIVQKTKLTDECGQSLLEVLQRTHMNTDVEKRTFVASWVEALESREDRRTRSFIVEQLCDIICPPKPEPVYRMNLSKTPTQEEFIRGGMTKNPYSTKDVGPLMRDVKNKICRDLDLGGLLDDDNGMELLVHNQIIKLDLPVVSVYEQVWQKHGGGESPMLVVYRLQGLDGEATEPIVENLDESGKEDVDPEEEFAVTAVMPQCKGIRILVGGIDDVSSGSDVEHLTLLLRLLGYCCQIRVNRAEMIEINGVSVLLRTVKNVFATETHQDIAQSLLSIIECVLEEANERKIATGSMNADHTEIVAQMGMFIDKLSSPTVKANPKLMRTMTRILPFLTYGDEEAMGLLIEYFLPHLNFDLFDANSDDSVQELNLECFVKVAENVKTDSNGDKLKSVAMSKGLTAAAIRYLCIHCVHQRGSAEWNDAIEKASLPYVLRLLTGLAMGHNATQHMLLQQGALRGVHQLEKVVTEKKLGSLAENLLEAASANNDEIRAAVASLREATENSLKALAQSKREQMLQQLGFKVSSPGGSGGPQILHAAADDFDDIEDETGLTCMVCQEGYTFKPNEILGIYVYAKRAQVNIGDQDSQRAAGSSGEYGFTSVTHFNAIHFSCHRDATRSERSMKQPKEEWEGATLRNSQTKCNNIFPLRGPTISEEQYAQCIDRYWAQINNLGRCDGSRFFHLVHDLRFLIRRFAYEESFSQDSRGGGRSSNVKYIPFLIQMGLHIIDAKGNSQRRIFEKAASQFLMKLSGAWPSATNVTLDAVFQHMVLSIFVMSPDEWRKWRLTFLQAILKHGTPSGTGSSAGVSDELYNALKPAVIFLSIVNRIQETYKKSLGGSKPGPSQSQAVSPAVSASPVASSPLGSAIPSQYVVCHRSDEAWVEGLREYLLKNDMDAIDDAEEILSGLEEEVLPSESFLELFDVIEVLADIQNAGEDADSFVLKHAQSV